MCIRDRYYIFEHDNPIGDGETIAGLENGDMNPDIKWKVQYEDSLIQPVRTVIDLSLIHIYKKTLSISPRTMERVLF